MRNKVRVLKNVTKDSLVELLVGIFLFALGILFLWNGIRTYNPRTLVVGVFALLGGAWLASKSYKGGVW